MSSFQSSVLVQPKTPWLAASRCFSGQVTIPGLSIHKVGPSLGLPLQQPITTTHYQKKQDQLRIAKHINLRIGNKIQDTIVKHYKTHQNTRNISVVLSTSRSQFSRAHLFLQILASDSSIHKLVASLSPSLALRPWRVPGRLGEHGSSSTGSGSMSSTSWSQQIKHPVFAQKWGSYYSTIVG